MRARQLGDHEQAVRLLRAGPNHGIARPEIAAARAHSAVALDRVEDAFEAARETGHGSMLGASFWLHLCKLLVDNDDPAAASVALDRAREADPGHPGIPGHQRLLSAQPRRRPD